LAIKIIKQV